VLVTKAIDSLEDLVRALALETCVAANSHLAVLIEPSPTNRAISQARIITRAVFEILWDRHLANNPAKAAEFYRLFERNEFQSAAAEWILGSEMPQLLGQGQTIQVPRIRNTREDVNLTYNEYGTGDKRKREDSEPRIATIGRASTPQQR